MKFTALKLIFMKKYFYSDGVNQKGPYTLDELAEKKLNKNTLVWFDDITDWAPLHTFPELLSVVQNTPPPLKLKNIKKSKSKFIVLLTAIFLVAFLILSYFILYPKWLNDKKYNAAMEVFKRTDSIQFDVFNELEKSNYIEASFMLGWHFRRNADTIQATSFYKKALTTKNRLPALFGLYLISADSLNYKKNINDEFIKWIDGIKKEDWVNQINASWLGDLNLLTGMNSDINTQIVFLDWAVENGSVLAMELRANKYLYSTKQELEDLEKGIKLLKKASSLGYSRAMTALGNFYQFQKDDTQEALKWYRKAAKLKNLQAEYRIGEMYDINKEISPLLGASSTNDSINYWLNRAILNKSREEGRNKGYRDDAKIRLSEHQKLLAQLKRETESKTKTQFSRVNVSRSNCKWCGNTFGGDGYSISYDKIIQGNTNDRFSDELVHEVFSRILGSKEKYSNVGNYCSRKCAAEAYYSGETN